MIHSFCKEMKFPQEAETVLSEAYTKIKNNKTAHDELMDIMDGFIMGEDEEYKNVLNNISERLNINIYTLNMIFVIMTAKSVRHMYWIKGYPDQLYLDTMYDTFYKLNECKKLYNVWGNFTIEWFRIMCQCRIFALGRLQFEPFSSPVDYKNIIKKGDRVINVHIPSGSPLKIEDVYDSFEKAYKFFGAEGDLILTCHSWLLYPPQRQMYSEGSNLRKFYDLWDIQNVEETEGNFWRVFYKEEGTDLSEIVPETSFAKKLLEYLKNGGKMGCSRSFIVYRPGRKYKNGYPVD